MKILLSLIVMLMSLSALAVERRDLDKLLVDKGTTIAALEARGMELIMGERTGGGISMKYSDIEVIFTNDEAFFRKEIQTSIPLNVANLSKLKALQAGGRHILASDIIGVISK